MEYHHHYQCSVQKKHPQSITNVLRQNCLKGKSSCRLRGIHYIIGSYQTSAFLEPSTGINLLKTVVSCQVYDGKKTEKKKTEEGTFQRPMRWLRGFLEGQNHRQCHKYFGSQCGTDKDYRDDDGGRHLCHHCHRHHHRHHHHRQQFRFSQLKGPGTSNSSPKRPPDSVPRSMPSNDNRRSDTVSDP